MTYAETATELDGTIAYFERVGEYHILSYDEERTADRDTLIAHNLRLVASIARKYLGYGMDYDDMIQEGNLGLMKAAEKFDPARGLKFSTYATWWIEQHITRGLHNHARPIRIPVHMSEAINQLKRAHQSFDHTPTKAELAERLGWPPERIERTMRAASQQPLSLGIPVGEDGDSELMDFVPAPLIDIDELAHQNQVAEAVRAALAHLDTREQRILWLRYRDRRTLEQIGNEIGLTRERVRQIQADALAKLRTHACSSTLRRFLDD